MAIDQTVDTGTRSIDTWMRRAGIVLSVLGLLVAGYLIFFKLFPTSTLCVGAGGCETVNTSVYSEVMGIPVAALGAGAYAAMLGLLVFENRVPFLREWGPMMVFGLAFAGFLYSAYLTYIELAVIHAVCPYCVASAVIITLILAVSAARLRRYV
jgi:uncharacterized membrane protein